MGSQLTARTGSVEGDHRCELERLEDTSLTYECVAALSHDVNDEGVAYVVLSRAPLSVFGLGG